MIDIKDLSKVYLVGDERVRALDHATLHIYPKEFVSIIGPSGSGKSTLMNIIGCLDIADAGSYKLDNLPIEAYTENELAKIRNQKIGFVFQQFNLIPKLTAWENVELPLIYQRVPRAERQTRVKAAPDESGFAEGGAAQESTGTESSTAPTEAPGISQLQTAPAYELVNGAWKQIEFSSVAAGDIVLFAADQNGEFVWIVRIKKAENQTSAPSGGFPSGNMGGYAQTPEPEFELYSQDLVEIAAVTPQDTMTMEILIDELDIRHLQVGMTAEIKIDALGGEKYTATITEISNTGTNNGGNSKYTVVLTMDRTENMLSGMNATATIVLSATGDVLTVPADALVENGNQTLVYTGYDEENGVLIDPVTVKVGCSDGETVEILEGLSKGQTYYYAYYDTLEISLIPEFGGRSFQENS